MKPLRSPPTGSDTLAGHSSSQPNLSVLGLTTNAPIDTPNITRHKRKRDEDIQTELTEIRKGMTEMMQMLTTINNNQTETIKKLSEDVVTLNGHVKEIRTVTDTLTRDNEKINSNLNNLISKHNENNKQICKIESELRTLQSTSGIAPNNNIIEETVMAELSERLARGKNIIITGLKEPKSASYKERQETDKREVLNILNQISKDYTEPKHIIRLGRYAPDKHRALKVCFSTQDEAKFILRSKNNEKISPFKIFSDQTPQQQAYFRNIRDELQRRVNNGEKNLSIRYIKNIPKIVENESKN